jgi:hypothetical protein
MYKNFQRYPAAYFMLRGFYPPQRTQNSGNAMPIVSARFLYL